MTPSRRRTVWLPDDLWRRVVAAAARLTLAEGEQVTASEFVRRAIERAIEERDATG